LLVVGLTGGIASGKSSVAEILQGFGAPVIASDALARDAVQPGEEALSAIVRGLGDWVLTTDGQLDRPKVARRIFAEPSLRAHLEQILHPVIRERTLQRLSALDRAGQPVAVCDIPLLFEVGLHQPGSFIDQIWLVYVPEQAQLSRLMLRDGLDSEEARSRLLAQWPMDRKRVMADVVIDNSGTRKMLVPQVEQAWNSAVRSSPMYRGLRGISLNRQGR